MSANDIPKINEALEEAASLIKRGWTQDAAARAKNDLDFLRNLQKAVEDGADIDVDLEADIAGHIPLSYDDSRAVCWSIEGAVWLAAKKKGLTEELEEHLLCRICASIIDDGYTTPPVDILDKYSIIGDFLSEWNDAYDRTKEEVLALLKAAQVKSWRCKVREVLYEAFRKGRCSVNANDIPKINEALEEAASLIKRGWTQESGTGARTKNDHNIDDLEDDPTLDEVGWDDPRAVCWCLIGAAWLAAKKKGLTEELEASLLCRICASIIDTDYVYTTPTIDTLNMSDIIVYFLSEWNDAYDRTKEEVLAILKAAQIEGDADKR